MQNLCGLRVDFQKPSIAAAWQKIMKAVKKCLTRANALMQSGNGH
jgi:hypothetical protein